MTDKSKKRLIKKFFGWLAFTFSIVFTVNILIGKLSVINQWGWARPPGFVEFIILFMATGCFIIFATLSNISDLKK